MSVRPATSSDRRLALEIAGAALVIGLASTLQSYADFQRNLRPIAFSRLATLTMPPWLLWAAFSPLIIAATRWLRGRHWAWHAGVHAPLALLLIAAHSAAVYWVQRETGVTDLIRPIWIGGRLVLVNMFTIDVLTYAAIVGAIHARRSAWSARDAALVAARLSTQLATARLDALRLQLHPHFLFNAMNTVAMLIRQGAADDAVRALASLSDILRHLVASPDAPEVRLRDELGLVDRCLEIERIRFGDRLHVIREIEPETLDALVPNLVLQPVVENALRHGIADRATGTVRIASRRSGDRLVLEVQDDGRGLPDGTDLGAGAGVGIRNTVERLTGLYGDDFDLELEDRSHDGQPGARASIALPFHTSPAWAPAGTRIGP